MLNENGQRFGRQEDSIISPSNDWNAKQCIKIDMKHTKSLGNPSHRRPRRKVTLCPSRMIDILDSGLPWPAMDQDAIQRSFRGDWVWLVTKRDALIHSLLGRSTKWKALEGKGQDKGWCWRECLTICCAEDPMKGQKIIPGPRLAETIKDGSAVCLMVQVDERLSRGTWVMQICSREQQVVQKQIKQL